MTTQQPATPAPRLPTGQRAGDLRRLECELAELGQSVGTLAHELAPAALTEPGLRADLRARLAILQDVLHRTDGGLPPQLDPFAPAGHSWPEAERLLGVAAGEARPVLEELADLGLLQRKLHNRVHVCPQCTRCQLNFRETCTSCSSIDLGIERLVHHFACAYIGLESEYADGIELRCPKCRERLFQLGQDFERPHETYVCGDCHSLMEAPFVNGQCLACATQFPLREAKVLDIHVYAATALTARAVELGRLTALQVVDLLFDPAAKLARLDYLVHETRREFVRLRRHGGEFSVLRLQFESDGAPFPLFQLASAEAIRDLGVRLTGALRELDLVAPVDTSTLCVLLPETAAKGADDVAERLDHLLAAVAVRDDAGRQAQRSWDRRSWDAAPADVETALAWVRGEN